MTTLPDRQYLKTREVAQYFGVCVRTVERWADKGDLVAMKINGSMRINRESVLKIESIGIGKGLKM
jgi:excisionase family DNA binding protein